MSREERTVATRHRPPSVPMARRRNSEVLWSLMTRIKSPHSFQVRRYSSGAGNGEVNGKSKPKKATEKAAKSPSRARLCLIVSAIAPGLTFGVFVVVGNAAAVVSAGAVVPSLLVAAVASLLAGGSRLGIFLFTLIRIMWHALSSERRLLSKECGKAKSRCTCKLLINKREFFFFCANKCGR